MDLTGTTQMIGHYQVLVLTGVIDLSSLPALHELLQRATPQHSDANLVVDLDGVEALDDCGLGVLLGAAGRYREQGRELMVVSTSAHRRHRFDMTGLSRALRVLSSISEAGEEPEHR